MDVATLPAPPAVASTASPRAIGEFFCTFGATLVLFPLGWAARAWLGFDTAELAWGFTTFYAAHLINDPHFAVTYLLFYRNGRGQALGGGLSLFQRLRYVFAGFVVPVGLVSWAALAIASGSGMALGWMMELMFALVGWHYVKQAFGVLVVLAGRRGVKFDRNERRTLLAHALFGWWYAWCSPAAPARDVEERGVVYRALAHPAGLETVSAVLLVSSTLVLAFVLAAKVRRERRWPPLAPLLGFLGSIWVWTIYSSVDPLMIYVIPALHSVQYLYFVWLLRRNEARAHEGPPTFGRPAGERLVWLGVSAVALGFLQFHVFPGLLDVSRFLVPKQSGTSLADLGATPWFASAFAIVNIHHYFMDTVIWRRENPETRFLYDDALPK